MKRIVILAGAVLIAAVLAGCSPGIHTLDNSITFDSSGMVVHAPGRGSAHVDRNGELSIDGKAIAVTPAQRQLLQRYYRQARDLMGSSKAMGEHGIAMAARGIGDAITSIFHHDSATANRRMEAESQRMEQAADKLCTDIKALGTTQQAIATAIPAFAPYGSHDRLECTVTHSTTYKVSGAKASRFTYALRESRNPDVTTVGTSSQPSTSSHGPTAPTASRP